MFGGSNPTFLEIWHAIQSNPIAVAFYTFSIYRSKIKAERKFDRSFFTLTYFCGNICNKVLCLRRWRHMLKVMFFYTWMIYAYDLCLFIFYQYLQVSDVFLFLYFVRLEKFKASSRVRWNLFTRGVDLLNSPCKQRSNLPCIGEQ